MTRKFVPSTPAKFNRKQRTALSRAKKNPSGPPLWPVGLGIASTFAAASAVPLTLGASAFAVPVLATGTVVYGLYYLGANALSFFGYVPTARSFGLYLHPVPLAAGGAGFLAARHKSEDTTIRILGTVIGYGVGLLAYKPYYEQQTIAADAQWCLDHSFLSQFAPTCHTEEVTKIASEDAQTQKFCKETYVIPWFMPSCY